MIEHNNAVDTHTHTIVVSSSHARPPNRHDKNKLLSRPVRKYRGVPRRRADLRGARHSRRVFVDVKTAAGTRVPERAGHVQDASEATSISLRHTYAAVECSLVYYNILCLYISIIKILLLLYYREEYVCVY